MKFRLIAPFGFIVLLTVGLLLWFGVRLANDEGRRVQEGLRAAHLNRLEDVEVRIQEGLSRIAIEVKREIDSYQAPVVDWARSVSRKNRFVRQVFLLDSDRRFVFPNPKLELTVREQDALLRTRSAWSSGVALDTTSESKTRGSRKEGWHTWFWDTGLQFLYWQKREDGNLLCMELDRIAVFAELIAALPESELEIGEGRTGELVVLLNERQREIYRWGGYREAEDETPYVSLSLSEPIASWMISLYLVDPNLENGLGASVRFNFVSGFIFLSIVILLVAIYAYREYSRELREASSRLTFVNQVSHELKTPLTNIRLYSEILEGQLEDESPSARQSLGVIQGECRRLSRLIKNVLSFGRSSKEGGSLKLVECNVDAVVESVIEGFAPSLKAAGIVTGFYPAIEASFMLDRDILEQILGNLISNVEKYAASGASLKIDSRVENEMILIEVGDRGAGIPKKLESFVFEPFSRLSNRVSDGVAGTGIGLTIARDLARKHGGDIVLLSSELGAHFRVILRPGTKGRGL
jgi:signal transduction histidine kinase